MKSWLANMELLLQQKWLTVSINQTISLLTIKTMPGLIDKIKEWKSKREIGHFFSVVSPGPEYLVPDILGNRVFEKDFEHILNIMPRDTNEDVLAFECMQGISHNYSQSMTNQVELLKLKTFLDETDRRRGTSWAGTFPWLVKELQHVV
jgi:hypothetical protein